MRPHKRPCFFYSFVTFIRTVFTLLCLFSTILFAIIGVLWARPDAGQDIETRNGIGMKMNRFAKIYLCLAVLLLLLLGASASAETTVTFSPENPKMGEYVDVTVTPGRQGAVGVRYELSTSKGVVFKDKDKELSKHYTASFRPREQGTYTLTAIVSYGKKDEESVSITIPVSGTAEIQEGSDVLYSQKDGWWHDKTYSKKHHRSLEKAGCAIFTLSHVLQRMGFTGEEVMPDKLATKYSGMYIEGRGTDNERLLMTAGENFGFQTHHDLIESESELKIWLNQGCRFSFMIVIGHIALADGLSEDGTKVHVVDSAPGATAERIKKATMYIQKDNGIFAAVASPEEPKYLVDEENARVYELKFTAVEGNITGGYVSTVEVDDETGDVTITNKKPVTNIEVEKVWAGDITAGEATMVLYQVTGKKGASFTDGNGKKKDGITKPIPYGSMAFVIGITDKQYYIAWKDSFGFINKESAELLPVSEDSFRTGLITLNGKTAGTSPITVRKEPSAKAKSIGEWKPGTPVAVISEKGDFYFVEGKGLRGWVNQKFLKLEGEKNDGQKVDEGE